MALETEEEVRAALASWSSAHVTRRDTSKLTLQSMDNKGPVQIVLTSVFERRGVTYELTPAPRRSRRPQHPDPWAHTFEFPEGDDAPVGAKRTHLLNSVAVHMGCSTCSDSGDMRCSRCDGDGRISTHNGSSRRCGKCQGRGQLPCYTCNGSGALYGKPTLWAAIESVSPHRLVEADDLPNSVYLALSEAPVDGEVVHRQEGASIEGLSGYAHRGAGAYRDAATERPEAALVRTLCKSPEIPEDVRLLRQRLELRRVDVWAIKSQETEPFWVLGDPVQVLPPKVLRSLVGKLLWPVLILLMLALIIGLIIGMS